METESVEESAGNAIESTKQITNISIKYEIENETKYNPDAFPSDEMDAGMKVNDWSESILESSAKSKLVESNTIDGADQFHGNDTRTIILEKVPKTESEIVGGDDVDDPSFCFVEENYTHSSDAFSDGDSNSDPDPDLARDPFADVHCDPSFSQSQSQSLLMNPADVNDISNPSSSTSTIANKKRRRNRRRKILEDSKLQCQLCRETLSSEKELVAHIEVCSLSHKNSLSFCVPCNKLFTRAEKYRDHALRKHDVEAARSKPFKCQVCSKSFAYEETFTAHLVLHQETITANDALKLKPFKCPDCSFSFDCRSSLTRHQISHQAESGFKCSMPNCDKEFKMAYYLQLHMQRLHSIQEKPFKCLEPNCEKSFTTNGQLQKHKVCHSTLRPFKCTDLNCGKTFPSNDRLAKHMAKAHNKAGPYREAQGTLPFKCGECDRAFCKNWLLTSHLKTHQKREENNDVFTCPETICGKIFKHKVSLRRHVAICHTNKDVVYTCTEPNCSATFARKGFLHSHLRKTHRINPNVGNIINK